MRVIDLLNKIANGEDVPKKIKFEDDVYYLASKNCYRSDITDRIFEEHFIFEDLNDEIEIIEEDKKIEKYNTGLGNGEWHEESVRKDILENKNIEDYLIRVMKEVDAVKFKTFEIIDKINKEK